MVMLISLKSGAVGLNLTAASNVFLVPPNQLLLMPTADRSVIRGGNLLSKPRQLIGFIELVFPSCGGRAPANANG